MHITGYDEIFGWHVYNYSSSNANIIYYPVRYDNNYVILNPLKHSGYL
jgi:hypothetical protein